MQDPQSNPQNQNEKKKNSDIESSNGNVAEIIVGQILASNAVLFQDQYGEACVALEGNGCRAIKLSSTEFREWIAYQHWQETKKVLAQDVNGKVIQTLSGYARYEGSRYPLSIRMAKQNEAIWYDLGDGSAIRITVGGWDRVPSPPIMFKSMPSQRKQDHPRRGGSIDQLRSYVNIGSEDDWLLFLAYLVTSCLPEIPHPLLVFHGPQGAGKTTVLKLVKELIDPSLMQGQALPTSIAEFVQIASHHAFLFFDNLSNMTIKMSDALARAATGDSFSKRRLYSDDEDIIYWIQRPIGLNGINQIIVKPDLLDRSVLINLQAITSTARTTDKDIWEAFRYEKPEILGALFDVLVKAMSIYPDVQLNRMPRMADFTRWGCAVAEATGRQQLDFLSAYQRNIDRQSEEAINANPVAQAVIAFMAERENWTGTATQLKRALDRVAFELDLKESRYWPKEPSWMGRIIQELKVTLGTVGLLIENAKTSQGRTITIRKITTNDAMGAMPTKNDAAKTPKTLNP